jgi:hypothetical protein
MTAITNIKTVPSTIRYSKRKAAVFVLCVIAAGTFWYVAGNETSTGGGYISQKCPDDYATPEEQTAAMDSWTNTFYDSHPGATLLEWVAARKQFWVENDCEEALQRYADAKAGKADPATIELIKDVIWESLANT